MSELKTSALPIGQYLAKVREEAGMSQVQLSQAVTFSSATLSRMESGEKPISDEDLAGMLAAFGTPKAAELAEFVTQAWDHLARPAFDHPDRGSLWQANLALRRLADLRNDDTLTAVFMRQVDLYEGEIRRVAEFLASCEHQIAFVGSIGVGKSTGICKMTSLLKPGEDKPDRQNVLESGAGGITLCDVHIAQGPGYGLRIEPRTEDSIRRDVEDFCDYLIAATRPDAQKSSQPEEEEDDGDPLGISKEVVRAIRNMADLREERREEGGKRVRIDRAKELAKTFSSAQDLRIQVMTKMGLPGRDRLDEWYPANHPQSPMHWLQDLFAQINNGRHPKFTIPRKIEIIVPDPVLASRELPIRIIDTKGIDQTAERQDLESHFDNPKTLVVLCSRFNDAPEVALQTLLRRARDGGARDLPLKTVLFVLPRPEEAMAEKYDDGTHVETDSEGYDRKREGVLFRLNQQQLSSLSVEFFNAREESGRAVRERLIEKIVDYRRHHADQVTRLSKAVGHLDENRKDANVRAVFEHVMGDLNAWIRTNRHMDFSEKGVQQPLLSAINGTRYASRIRAAVRRYGNWDDLDYYHHLAYGVRKLAVDQIGTKIDGFKVIANNLMTVDGVSVAKEFLQGVVSAIDAALDQSYRHIQSAGREMFKQTLANDHEFWAKCEERWGRGPGYRTAIRDMTDEEFTKNLEEAHRIILGLLSVEWEKLMSLMERVLQEQTKAPAA